MTHPSHNVPAKTMKQTEDKAALGGMRGPALAVTRLKLQEVGRLTRRATEDYVKEHLEYRHEVLAACSSHP